MANTFSTVGRLTRDPQSRQTNGGSTVVLLDIADDTSQKGSDGKTITNFLRASVWGKRGDTAMQYLHKGDPIYVSGELVLRNYQAQDGSMRTGVYVNYANFSFVPAPPKQQAPQKSFNQSQGGYRQQSNPQPDQPSQGGINLDDLPFD